MKSCGNCYFNSPTDNRRCRIQQLVASEENEDETFSCSRFFKSQARPGDVHIQRHESGMVSLHKVTEGEAYRENYDQIFGKKP